MAVLDVDCFIVNVRVVDALYATWSSCIHEWHLWFPTCFNWVISWLSCIVCPAILSIFHEVFIDINGTGVSTQISFHFDLTLHQNMRLIQIWILPYIDHNALNWRSMPICAFHLLHRTKLVILSIGYFMEVNRSIHHRGLAVRLVQIVNSAREVALVEGVEWINRHVNNWEQIIYVSSLSGAMKNLGKRPDCPVL